MVTIKASKPGTESGTEPPRLWAPWITEQHLSNSRLWWRRRPLEWIMAVGAQPPSQESAVAGPLVPSYTCVSHVCGGQSEFETAGVREEGPGGQKAGASWGWGAVGALRRP